MPAKKPDIEGLISEVRSIISNPSIVYVTPPMIGRMLGCKRHEVEQVFHKLNLSGELSQAMHPLHPHCCGDCRAARYRVLRHS